MEADSGGEADGPNGLDMEDLDLALNDEETMTNFLQEIMGGEIDVSMLEEFRESAQFDELLQDALSMTRNGGSSTVSRRPSVENEKEDKQNKQAIEIPNNNAEEVPGPSGSQHKKYDRGLPSGTSSKKRYKRKPPKKYISNAECHDGSTSDSSHQEEQEPTPTKKLVVKDLKIRDKLKICFKPNNSGNKNKSPSKPEKPSKKTNKPSTSTTTATIGNKQDNEDKPMFGNGTKYAAELEKLHKKLLELPSSSQEKFHNIRKCTVGLHNLVEMAKLFSNDIHACTTVLTPELEEKILACERTLFQAKELTMVYYPKAHQKVDNATGAATVCNKECAPVDIFNKKTSSLTFKNSDDKTPLNSSHTRPPEDGTPFTLAITDKSKTKSMNKTDELKSKSPKQSDDEVECRKKGYKKTMNNILKLNETAKNESFPLERAEGYRKSVDRATTPESEIPTFTTTEITTEESQPCCQNSLRQSSPVKDILKENESVQDTTIKIQSKDDSNKMVLEPNSSLPTLPKETMSEKEGPLELDKVISTDHHVSQEISELESSELPPQSRDDSEKHTSENTEIHVPGNVEKANCNTTPTDSNDEGKKAEEDKVNTTEIEALDKPATEVYDDDDYEMCHEPEEPHMPDEEITIPDTEAVDKAVVVGNQESSPDNKAQEFQKSPSPERIVSISKKKKFIESSSDDGDNIRKDHDDSDSKWDRKKSSDEENCRGSGKKVSFERKKDAVDSRSKKFDEFQNERQRKLSEKKKEKEKSKENDALEEIFKEKTLTGSFRIPKRTTGYSKPEPRNVSTPLAVTDAPRENLQFEKFRKGKDKEKESYKEYNNALYVGPTYSKRDRGVGIGAMGYNKHNRDDGRAPILVPLEDEIKRNLPDLPDEPIADAEPVPEPVFYDEPAGDDFDDCNNNDNENTVKTTKDVESKGKTSSEQVTNEKLTDEMDENDEEGLNYDPTVPLDKLVSNVLVDKVVEYININRELGRTVDLPDTDKIQDLAKLTMRKIGWWFNKHDSNELETGDAYASDSNDSNDSSERSFMGNLDFSEGSDDEDFATVDRTTSWTSVNEHCGAQTLYAKYRTGPGDTFANIFQLRTKNFVWDKDKDKQFQARCNLCNQLVVGKVALAAHVSSPAHTSKMSRLDETAGVEPKTPENDKTAKGKESGNSEKEKTAEKSNRNEDSASSKKGKNESDKKDEGKEDSKRKRKEDERVHRDKKSEKRKRSKERRSSEKSRDSDEGGEVGVTSTGLPIKIPASAMPEKKQSDSRDHRSRSPRHKRDRSRSPRHKRSKSPRKKSRSPRRRRKSRSPITRVERVPREPTHVRENRERRRSTSAERVERFLARTNRRSRSPSNGHVRKRHRRSRSKSPTPSSITKRDNREFHEKLALMTEGKWSDDMENRWKLMEVDEAMFKESFGDRQKLLIEVPEKHENYGEEWTHFWEQRFQEVEEQGLDAEKYDYVPEWKDFWNKRLKELLAKEFETKIKEIKKKYGMDFDTLKRLRCKPEVVPVPPAPVLTPHLVVAPSLAMIPPLPHVGLPPLPVPAPHNTMVPQMVPPPQAATPLPVPSPKASILAFTSGSVSSRSTTSDDHTSRPMSISDGGDDNSHSGVKTSTNAPSKPAVPVTAGDIMSTWEKLRTGGGSSNLSATSGDRVTAQQTSLPKAVTNNIDAKSNADSGSIASYEFDGYDIPQVLRLMCSVEDHLSYYAIKVQEYFTRAEEMELKKRNAAKKLLDEEEFVALLFTLRERFMKMIRANVLHRDVLRSLNHIVYALDSMMESPQCQMYKNKLASAAESNSANSNVEPEVKNNASVIDKSAEDARVSSVRTEKVTPAATHRTMEEEIARLLTVFLLTNGHADISDSNLRYFVKKMVPPLTPTEPTSQPTRASPGNPASGPSDTRTFNVPPSSNQQRPAGRPEPGQLDGQWDAVDGSMFSRTYNIANSRAGSGFPSLPTAYRPSSEEDEPPRHGRGMSMPGMGRGRGSGSNNMPSSENSGAQSPFRGRGFGGINSSYPPYYDQGGLNTQSVSSCSQNNISTLDAASSVVTSMLGNTQFRQTQTLLERQKRPQVSVDQLTSSVVNEEQPPNEIVIDSDDSITIFDNHQSKTVKASPPPAPQPRLPPGILNMIMKEKKRQQAPEAGEILSEEESQFDRRVEREPQKKKKKKRKKERHHECRDSSSDSEADSRRRYHRKRKRRKRKRKDERYETRRRTPSPSPARSEISSGSSIQLLRKAPPRHDDSDIEVLEELPLPTTPPSLIQGRALLRESNLQDKDNCTYNWNMADVTSPIASPPLSIVGSSSAKSVCRGDENNQFAPTCPGKKPKKRSANWDTVSEASSRARLKKHSNSTVVRKDNNREEENFVRKSKERKASRIATSNKKDDEEAVCSSKKVSKVTSVSETFWTTNDDAKSLCSISTNESLDVKESDKTPIVCGAQPVRKYRASCEIEKEPGEISDSISSVSSVLND